MLRPQYRTRLLLLAGALLAAGAGVWAQAESSYEKHLDIRTSRIPHAGNGVFTKVPIPKGAYIGAYGGGIRPQLFYPHTPADEANSCRHWCTRE